MLCDIIDDYGLLSYVPLDIQSPTSLSKIVELDDKANGFSLYQYVTQSSEVDPELQVYSKNDSSYYDMVDGLFLWKRWGIEMNEKYAQGEDDFWFLVSFHNWKIILHLKQWILSAWKRL